MLRSYFCLRHALGIFQRAHVMAVAVHKLLPDAQLSIGPWLEKDPFCQPFNKEREGGLQFSG